MYACAPWHYFGECSRRSKTATSTYSYNLIWGAFKPVNLFHLDGGNQVQTIIPFFLTFNPV